MSSANAFAALYAEQPDYMIEDEGNELELEHDGTHEDTEVAPPGSTNKSGLDATAAEFKPAEPVPAARTAAPTPPDTTPGIPEPVSPIIAITPSTKKRATHAETLLAIFTPTPRMTWAEEKDEEERAEAAANAAAEAKVKAMQEKGVEAKAAAEAQARAEADPERKEAAEGWANLKKSKKRNQRKKKVAVTEAGSPEIEPTKPAEPIQEEKVQLPVSLIEVIREPKAEVEAAERTMPVREEERAVPAAAADIETAQVQQSPGATSTVATSTETTLETTVETDLEPLAGISADTKPTPTTQEPGELASATEQDFILETMAEADLEDKAEDEIAPAVEAGPSAEKLVTEAAEPVLEHIDATEPATEVKEVAATEAAPESTVEVKKTKSSRRREQKKAAKKAEAAVAVSLSSSSAEKAPDDIANDGEGLQEPDSPSKQSATVHEKPPAGNEVKPETTPTVSPEPATEVPKSAAAAAAYSWDDWIEKVPTIEGRNRKFELEEEAQARYAAGLLSDYNVVVTTAQLQRRHEAAELARRSAVPASTIYAQAVIEEASVVEDFQEPEVEIDKTEEPAAPTSMPAEEPEIGAAAEAEELPAPALDPKENVPVRATGQRSITDFFKKGPVVTIQEVSSLTPERVPSPGEYTEAVTVEAPESVDLSEIIEMEGINPINVADYLDYRPDTDDEEDVEDAVSEASEDAEDLPATSTSIAGNIEGDQVTPEPTAATSSAQHIDADETVSDKNVVDQTSTPASGTKSAHEPVVVRQKKKRSKAQRNAAKKRVAAAATAAIPATVAEDNEPTNVALSVAKAFSSKTIRTGRANRTEKRTGPKPSGSGATLEEDAKQITVTLTEGTFANPEHQESKTVRQKLDAVLAAVSGKISDKVISWIKKADRQGKAPVKTHDMPQPQSVDQLGEIYHMMIPQTGAEAINRDRKKYMRQKAHRRAEEVRLGRQPGQSAAMKARIADLDEQPDVFGTLRRSLSLTLNQGPSSG